MAPYEGLLHARPRSDSGAVRLWRWARGRRKAWTVEDAAEAAEISIRRAREIVAAMRRARLLRRVSADDKRAIGAVILTSDRRRGRIIGVRPLAEARTSA